MLAELIIWLSLAVAATTAYGSAFPRLALRRYRKKLQRMTADELAAEARACARGVGYERSFADALLFRRQRDWSQALLARSIDDLYARVAARDQEEGNVCGPGSLLHDFYDSGLVHVSDILDERRPG